MASASRREASELTDPSTPGMLPFFSLWKPVAIRLFTFCFSEALLDLAADAQAKISETTLPASLVLDRSILDRLDYHLRRDPPPLSSLTHSSRRQLDSAGTVLWNACTRLMRQADGREIEEKKQMLICRGVLCSGLTLLFLQGELICSVGFLVMTFAFLLLESSTANDKNRTSGIPNDSFYTKQTVI